MANDWKKLARGKALLVIEDVMENGAYSNLALNNQLNNKSLSEKDKGLITEIVYGTVSHKIKLEWYLSHYIPDRDKLDKWVYYLIMISLYQMMYLDKVPNHAIVNDAVNIAKNRGNKRGAEKFVNAVLRQMTENEWPSVESIKRKNKRYSIEYSLPIWLVKKLIDQFGEDRALAIMKSLEVPSKSSIRVVNTENLEKLRQQFDADISELSPFGLTKKNGYFADHLAFLKGDITMQDETSQLVAPTLSIKPDDMILDACSAPGGKTMHMASYLETGKVVALDVYEHKLQLVAENAKRLGLEDKVETREIDARRVHTVFPEDSFDKILVDAPCSGIGLIRRKPDIKYNKDIKDFAKLQEVQLEILDSVCQTIRKGGIITYSTCTIFDEENFEVIDKFLQSHSNFEQVELKHTKEDIMRDGCLLITPEQYQTDGFFIGQIRRIF